jgi:hypothetical protein
MVAPLKLLPVAMWVVVSAVTLVGVKAFKHQATAKNSAKEGLQISSNTSR